MPRHLRRGEDRDGEVRARQGQNGGGRLPRPKRKPEDCALLESRPLVRMGPISYRGYMRLALTSLSTPFLNCDQLPKNFSSVAVDALSRYLRAVSSAAQM